MSLSKQISQRPWILAVAVSLSVVLWMLSGSLYRDKTETSDSFSNTKVHSTTTEHGTLPRVQVSSQFAKPVMRYLSVYGQTAPARTVEINAETEGRVTSVTGVRGRQLNTGDVILRLDKRDREARLAQARASVTEHRTSYKAQTKLKADSYVSDTQIAETLARLENAKAELIRAELDLDYMVIQAPFDGVLQERDVEIGDFVRAGDTVATFVDNTSIIVTGTIAEQEARYVKTDDVGNARLATGQQVTGRIRYVSPVADQSTRTFSVELEVANPDGMLPAGVTAEMQLPAGETLAQKISPSLLTLDRDGNIGIKIVNEFNQVEFYPVELAVSTPDGVWVTGLPDSAKIIVVGQGYVAAGQEVEPVLAQPETALADSVQSTELLK